MTESSWSAQARAAVLWDVIEEHLAEGEFLAEQLQRAFDSPTLTLQELQEGIEVRFWNQFDGLAVGGARVYERLIGPILAEPDPEAGMRIAVAALVALESGAYADVRPAMGHESPVVRAAVVEACVLASRVDLDSWIRARLRDATKAEERASLLRIAERRGLEPPPLIEWLQSDDSIVAEAAAGAARRADPARHLAVMEYLLGHEDRAVAEAALVPALAWGSRRASALCEAWALGDAPRPSAMVLCAALGSARQRERLSQMVAVSTHRRSALYALGFSGDPAHLPVLFGQLSSPDIRMRRVPRSSSLPGFFSKVW